MTDVHAEQERRADEPYEAGYQEGYREAAYERTGDVDESRVAGGSEEYEPSDTGYDPAVDGPEDVTEQDSLTGKEYVEPVDAGESTSSVDAYGDDTPAEASATTFDGGPEGALPEDVTPADAEPADSLSTVDTDDADYVSTAETTAVAGDSATTDTGGPTELVSNPDALMARWQEVQVSFVDDPRDSLRTADTLVQQVIEDMQQRFIAERAEMEQQWSAGDEVSTEDMRLLLQKYRTFFNRLISL